MEEEDETDGLDDDVDVKLKFKIEENDDSSSDEYKPKKDYDD